MLPYKAVLLDRDGVINIESESYVKSPEEWQPIPGSLAAIAKLTQVNIPIAIITNQSGIGRGLYDEKILASIHAKMLALLEKEHGKIEHIYFCPHTPDDNCECRKPKPGLILQALHDLKLTPNEVVLVGDSLRDIVAAQACGCDAVVVTTGYGMITKTKVAAAIPVFSNLAAWVEDFLWQSKLSQ